jgi:hypothetical protein
MCMLPRLIVISNKSIYISTRSQAINNRYQDINNKSTTFVDRLIEILMLNKSIVINNKYHHYH